MNDPFDLQEQWKEFLRLNELIDLDKEKESYKIMEYAFFGGMRQLFYVVNTHFPALSGDQTKEKMDEMIQQVDDYFKNLSHDK